MEYGPSSVLAAQAQISFTNNKRNQKRKAENTNLGMPRHLEARLAPANPSPQKNYIVTSTPFEWRGSISFDR